MPVGGRFTAFRERRRRRCESARKLDARHLTGVETHEERGGTEEKKKRITKEQKEHLPRERAAARSTLPRRKAAEILAGSIALGGLLPGTVTESSVIIIVLES